MRMLLFGETGVLRMLLFGGTGDIDGGGDGRCPITVRGHCLI